MKNKLKGNKGITLVVLIITIIVMLILVGVVLDLSIDGGLFGKAQEAVNKTNNKVAQTQDRVDELMGILEGIEQSQCDGHTYSNGICTKCGRTCTHNFNDQGTCTICGITCSHSYSNGVCTKCGKKCKHTFVNGVCTKCEYVEVIPQIGSYVYYEKEYTDVYQSGKKFDATNGWRYLGKTTDENEDTYYMIISTGIPVQLNYSSSSAAAWWDSNISLNANARAGKGLADPTKFVGITFADGTTTGASFMVGSKAEGVRTLTLEELNATVNAVAGTTRAAGSTDAGFKDISGAANGLFDMNKISGYTASYYYWLASPYPSYSNALCIVIFSDSRVYNYNSGSYGVRPVVLLSDIVFKAPTEGHTYWTFE